MKFDIIIFIVSTYMALVRVSIIFNGVWIEQNNEYKFKSSEAKGIMIPWSTTYAELVEKVSQVIDIDTLKFKFTIKFKHKTSDLMPPVTIKTDNDVEFFLEEIASRMEFKTLCLTFKCKSSSTVSMDGQPLHRPS